MIKMTPGERHTFSLIFDHASNYEIEPDFRRNIPGRVVWRYEFVECGTNQRFVYSGAYIHGINIKTDTGQTFTFRATVKRNEEKWDCIRLSRMSLQKSPENLFA